MIIIFYVHNIIVDIKVMSNIQIVHNIPSKVELCDVPNKLF